MKNKIYILIILILLGISLLANFGRTTEASYVTSSTSSSTKTTCVNCSWVLNYWLVACWASTEGDNYTCRSYGGKYDCCPSTGGRFWHYLNPVYRSSCDSSVISYSGSGNPPRVCTTTTTKTTVYTCHYISSVDAWSECVDGVSVATSVTWSTVPGQTCTDVATTRSCCSDTSWFPDTSTVCLGESFTQTSNCGVTRLAVGTGSCNRAPIAEITSPAGNISIDKGDNIDFSGTGTDPDGDAIVAYEWYDGACGSGTPISTQTSFSTASLGGGDHVIYFRVQDEPGLWSDCDSVNATVYPACDPATAPVGTIFCPGDNSGIEGTEDVTATLVSSSSDCTDSTKCEYYHLPTDGDPGSANNEIFCQKPSENLCDTGTPTAVEVGDNGKSWIWTCEGIYGGENVEGKAVKSCAYQEVSPN